MAKWIKTYEDEKYKFEVWECNGWYIRIETRRVNGHYELFYYVGNDDHEYSRAYRYFHTAKAFAEKHF